MQGVAQAEKPIPTFGDIAQIVTSEAAAEMWDRWRSGDTTAVSRRLYTAEQQAAQSPARKPCFNVNLPKSLTAQVMPNSIAAPTTHEPAPPKSSNTHRAPHPARGERERLSVS
jgi:hypothetical protein